LSEIFSFNKTPNVEAQRGRRHPPGATS
jgi:hypothetical protein